MADDDKNDVLKAYFAFYWAGALAVLALMVMMCAAKQHNVSIFQYIGAIFRLMRAHEHDIGRSSYDIFAFTLLGCSLGTALLGFLQFSFYPTLSAATGLACSLGIKLLLCHRWCFIFPNQEPPKPKELYLKAQSVYQDFNQPFVKIAMTGFGQLLLLSLYVWSVFDAGRPDFEEARIYVYYLLGVFLVMSYITGKDLYQKRRLDYDFWASLFYYVHTYGKDGYWVTEGTDKRRKVSALEADARYLFDTMINSMGLGCLEVGIPVQLAGNMSPLDFVLNTVAAFFIIELDDSDEVVLSYTEMEPNDLGDTLETGVSLVDADSRKPPTPTLEVEDDEEMQSPVVAVIDSAPVETEPFELEPKLKKSKSKKKKKKSKRKEGEPSDRSEDDSEIL